MIENSSIDLSCFSVRTPVDEVVPQLGPESLAAERQGYELRSGIEVE